MKSMISILFLFSLTFATSNIVPITAGGQSLGTAAKPWNTLFVDSIHNYGRTTDTIGWGTALKNDTSGLGTLLKNDTAGLHDTVGLGTMFINDTSGIGTKLKNDTSGLGTKINANQANYQTLAQAQGYMIAGQAVGTYWFGMQDSAASSSGGSSRYSPVIIPWYTADHPTLNGAVATLRVDAICCVNATAPTATFTVGLYPVTKGAGAAGLSIWSLGSVVSGSTVAFTTPSASSITRAVSSAITIPSDGMYVLGVTTTSATIATSSLVNITAYLEERN